MRRGLAWLGGALGLAALWRYLSEQAPAPAPPPTAPDPAAELRARLEQAREAPDDRDEFDAAEGQPVDEVEPREAPAAAPEAPPSEGASTEEAPEPGQPVETRSLAERRRAVHEKAQQALGEMQQPGTDA
jgi:hypothetical protein